MKKALLLTAVLLVASCSSGDGGRSTAPTAPTSSTVLNLTKETSVGCVKSRDALDSAAVAYYVENLAYPTSISDMTKYVVMRGDVELVETFAGDELDGPGWTLQMTGGGDSPPTFVCIDT